jgi:hypothetical protein
MDKIFDPDLLITALKAYWQKQRLVSPDLMSRFHSILPLFLNKPYYWEALGEGSNGVYSQEPLYRFDAFDCVTFVNTVLAVIFADGITAFKKNMCDIRYAQGKIDYLQRTDWFIDLDWNPRAQALGWIEDVTTMFKDKKQQSLAVLAKTTIDKPGWYAARALEDLHLYPPLGLAEKKARLAALQAEGKAFDSQNSQLTYVPLNRCFDERQQPISSFWNQMPAVSLIEIVRPNWPIKETWIDPQGRTRGYGTNLNVSHVGFALKNPKTSTFGFYHASSLGNKKVVSLDLFDYLRPYYDHNTIKGIHVELISPSCL